MRAAPVRLPPGRLSYNTADTVQSRSVRQGSAVNGRHCESSQLGWGEGAPLTSGELRLGMLLNIPECTGQHPNKELSELSVLTSQKGQG